jgi:predicted amidophosphoribosyltransferase
MDKKCANCGADIPDSARFCMECGGAVDSPSPAIASAPAQENHSPAAQTSRMRDWFIVHRKRAVIAAVALFVLLAALLV